eukprot:COSAG02_NODE_44136_length_368_cov_1.784387_1_plen_35_part_10
MCVRATIFCSFHDFPEGPDWWDTQHYKLILSQLR